MLYFGGYKVRSNILFLLNYTESEHHDRVVWYSGSLPILARKKIKKMH